MSSALLTIILIVIYALTTLEAKAVYICVCNGVTEQQIRDAVCDGVSSVCELSARLGVASACGCCRSFASQVLDETRQVLGLPENRSAA
jgi:bacterioferritin-associated ferredoxin